MNDIVFRPSSIVGLKEEDAKRVIDNSNLTWYISKRDDTFFPSSRNFYVDDRVTMKIKEGEVEDAFIG